MNKYIYFYGLAESSAEKYHQFDMSWENLHCFDHDSHLQLAHEENDRCECRFSHDPPSPSSPPPPVHGLLQVHLPVNSMVHVCSSGPPPVKPRPRETLPCIRFPRYSLNDPENNNDPGLEYRHTKHLCTVLFKTVKTPQVLEIPEGKKGRLSTPRS